jgi:hypothetical protein
VRTPWLVQFPQAREAPEDTRRALRALDPTAEVVYLGPRRWLVGRVRPNSESRTTAERMLATYASLPVTEQIRMSQAKRRYRVALAELARQGLRPVEIYAGRDADSRLVESFRQGQWRMQHLTENELFRELDEQEDAEKAEAAKQMQDLGTAQDAWKYAFTVSHSVTRTRTPSLDGPPKRGGRTLIKSIP